MIEFIRQEMIAEIARNASIIKSTDPVMTIFIFSPKKCGV